MKEKKPKEFKDINDVEIFASGVWNGDEFTDDDLDSIVQSFEETKDKLKPFLKIGHNEKQSLLAKDELPSAGIVDNVRRIGKKLLADFKNVPEKVFDVIKKKAFDKVSSELFVNINVSGKKYPLALKAVALLGGETPAVHDLESIGDLFSEEALAFRKDLDSKEYEFKSSYFNQMTQEDKTMEEELLKKIGKLEADNKTFQEEAAQANADAAKAEEEKKKAEGDAAEAGKKAEEADKAKADAEGKVAEVETEKKNALIDAKIKTYVDDGKVKPYQGKILEELLKKASVEKEIVFSIKVSDEETKEFKSVNELVDEFINSDVKLAFEEKSELGEPTGDDALVKKVKKYQEEHKGTSFKDAFIAVSPENE